MVDNSAFLFAGQGSQYVGMGKDLYDSFPESRAIFDKADKILGISLSEMCFAGAPDVLKLTVNSQPAILATTIAAYAAFKVKFPDVTPLFMAGLSLGEYSALIAAGSLTFEDGIRLIRRRAEIMDDASRRFPGKMAAVLDLDLNKVKEICLKSGAEIANLNAPGQIVISGKAEAVKEASKLCNEAGAKRVIELEVSGGFHSSLMFPASVELKSFLQNIAIGQAVVPVVSNYTAALEYRPAQIRENLVYQMYSSVRWEESIRLLVSQGVTKFYEFGPGKVLKGLMRRIEPSAQVVSIEKKEDILNLQN
ncbi:MAG: ACP S-malonyltransferase [Candidatus Omnitrophica bacterium]|nr:ACP S-malonyltransferase [Candidatus Omnitrophota bacterium]MBU1869427.1 ACP S-malonyltransferase [Candidatus Omnitrophota bacterium]